MMILTAHLRLGIVISLVCCGTAILSVLKETTVNIYVYRKGKEKPPNFIYFSVIQNPYPACLKYELALTSISNGARTFA